MCLDCFDIVHGRDLCHECVSTTALDRAPRFRRLVARGVDQTLLLCALLLPLASVPAGAPGAAAAAAVFGGLTLFLFFQVPLWVRRGQSVGKLLVNIAIRRPDGSKVDARRILLRRELPVIMAMQMPLLLVLVFVLTVSGEAVLVALGPTLTRGLFLLANVPGLVLALSVFGEDERGLHDLFADTEVVRL